MSKTIWYISKYAQNPIYGFPGRQFSFCKYFTAKGYNVTLIGSRSNGRNSPSLKLRNQIYYHSDGVSGVILNGPLINLGFSIKRIYSWLIFELRLLYWAFFKMTKKPDVIIVSSLSLLTFLSGIILKKRFNCKLVCEVRDIWPLTLMETKGFKKSNYIIKLLSMIERMGYKYANAIIGTMGNLQSHIQNVNPDFTEKVEYIPTGFDNRFYIEDPVVLNKVNDIFLKIPDGNFIVGYAGTIGLVNCVEEIVEVAKKMKDEAISFVIFGDGVLKGQLMERVKKMELTNVIFGGFFPKNNVPFILSNCHVLINPWLSEVTLYNYGVSPNKWIDYMFSGRPIIVSMDGYKNIINDADCGVFIKAGDIDAIVASINQYRAMSKEEMDRIGNNGKEYLLKNLTYEVLTNKYISVIENCK